MADATVKGGLFAQYSATLTQVQGTGALRRIIAQMFGRKQLREQRELLLTLNGATAGSAALATNARVAASSELGGLRTVESESLVNRVTAAGDITVANEDFFALSGKTHDPTPIANLDGSPLGERR